MKLSEVCVPSQHEQLKMRLLHIMRKDTHLLFCILIRCDVQFLCPSAATLCCCTCGTQTLHHNRSIQPWLLNYSGKVKTSGSYLPAHPLDLIYLVKCRFKSGSTITYQTTSLTKLFTFTTNTMNYKGIPTTFKGFYYNFMWYGTTK